MRADRPRRLQRGKSDEQGRPDKQAIATEQRSNAPAELDAGAGARVDGSLRGKILQVAAWGADEVGILTLVWSLF
ncbi:MAG: hypothetical protein AB8G17_07125 [Gammaproteobacteria bacterium]